MPGLRRGAKTPARIARGGKKLKGLARGDSGNLLAAAPGPTPTHIAQFTLSAENIITNVAAGSINGNLGWQFTHDGRTYNISELFTHGNGVQFRFRNSAASAALSNPFALAFIAADFTVDVGIAGQQPFKSSVMENVPSALAAAQYRAFPGRFQPNTDYTITISE